MDVALAAARAGADVVRAEYGADLVRHAKSGSDFATDADLACEHAWGGKGRNTCIDTEAGECDGYPWDTDALRARVIDDTVTSPVRIAPGRLISRWINHEAPFRATDLPDSTGPVTRAP